MFGEDIFASFFQNPFFQPIASSSNSRGASNGTRVERCSQRPRDLFSELSRAVDQVFEDTTRAFFRDAEMFSRHLQPGYMREGSNDHVNPRHGTGVTLNGELVNRSTPISRFGRHGNNDPVRIERNRLQWYDSNTRRSFAPPPPPTNRSEPCGRLTAAELAKLPLSTFCVQPGKAGEQENTSPENSPANGASGTPVCVRYRNDNQTECSPGSAYLQPVGRLPTLVPIQPIQSSPSRGFPECEVCLTEYRNRDRLRHLPCGHAFHSKCIDIWFGQSSTCPKCRAGVRTGLRRLERNRQPYSAANRTNGNAPVRAIQQRAPRTTGANNRLSSRGRQSTSGTRTQQAGRRSSTRHSTNRTASSDGSQHNTSSDTAPPHTESVQSNTATTGVPSEVPASTSGTGDLPLASVAKNDAPAVEQENLTAASRPCPSSRSPQRITQNTVSVARRRTNTRPDALGPADKSAFARRMAAEAAIRRAEQARQNQLQAEQQ